MRINSRRIVPKEFSSCRPCPPGNDLSVVFINDIFLLLQLSCIQVIEEYLQATIHQCVKAKMPDAVDIRLPHGDFLIQI